MKLCRESLVILSWQQCIVYHSDAVCKARMLFASLFSFLERPLSPQHSLSQTMTPRDLNEGSPAVTVTPIFCQTHLSLDALWSVSPQYNSDNRSWFFFAATAVFTDTNTSDPRWLSEINSTTARPPPLANSTNVFPGIANILHRFKQLLSGNNHQLHYSFCVNVLCIDQILRNSRSICKVMVTIVQTTSRNDLLFPSTYSKLR